MSSRWPKQQRVYLFYGRVNSEQPSHRKESITSLFLTVIVFNMNSNRAPKQWSLTKNESITSFEAWRQNLQYSLSLDANFAPFLADTFTWQKKSPTAPNRGLTSDGEAVPEARGPTTAQKNVHLELMLGQTANFCPVISRNIIVKNTTSEDNLLVTNGNPPWQTTVSPNLAATSHSLPVQPHSLPPFSSSVSPDPDKLLPDATRLKFQQLLQKYDRAFNPDITSYNSAAGPNQATVNMGPVQPPQRKGRVPQYSRNNLVQLQAKFDELEQAQVFRHPEDLGITVEYLNPSFLVKKLSGGHRLMTAFADVAHYSKPQPSLMPDVNTTLRTIAPWRYMIQTDLTRAFYQIPLAQSSLKYCGVATPFCGMRVYTRSAMGMPGSETALEEMMCCVLGDLIQEGCVAKLVDDLYGGGDSPKTLLSNWRRVLEALNHCNLRLSPTKTVIYPKSTTILGWIWSQGSLSASPHRIAVLQSFRPPQSVKGLCSFTGAYKVLSRVLPNCSNIVDPLESSLTGLRSSNKLLWDEKLTFRFKSAPEYLSKHKSIILPGPSDTLWIVTDGSVTKRGLGATLYVTRDSRLYLAGFYSAKLRKHQVTWLPCEVEALSIAAAVKHFSPFIVQSQQPTTVLTESKPCIQAIEKLCHSEFSASPRVNSFLTTVSHYQVSLQHLAGKANLPSDFTSRNAPTAVSLLAKFAPLSTKWKTQ